MSRDFTLKPVGFSDVSRLLRILCVAHGVGFLIVWLTHLVPWSLPEWLALSWGGLWDRHALWQPVTYLFLDDNVVNLIFTWLVLWWFGMPLIAEWGEREFLKYYLLCGSVSGLLASALYPASVFAGWTAAEFGLLVAFGTVHYDSDVNLFFVLKVPARHIALICGLIAFFSGPPSVRRMCLIVLGSAVGYAYLRWGWQVSSRLDRLRRAWPAQERSRAAERIERVQPRPGIEDEVDRILDKISAHGTQSLSAEERELLKRAAQKRKPGGHA